MLRDTPIHERRDDGEEVFLESFSGIKIFPPRHSDKLPLLKYAFENVDHVKHKGDEAYMLPLAVGYVHLFADGNGRTGRILHLLLRNCDSKDKFNEELKKSMTSTGGWQLSYDISPGYITHDVEKNVLERHGVVFTSGRGSDGLKLPDGFSRKFFLGEPKSEGGKMFKGIFGSDEVYCFISAYEHLKQAGRLDECTQGSAGDRTLDLAKMETILSQSEWQELIDGYFKLKGEHLEVMVQAFVKPDNFITVDGKTTLRDALIEGVQERYEERKEQERRDREAAKWRAERKKEEEEKRRNVER